MMRKEQVPRRLFTALLLFLIGLYFPFPVCAIGVSPATLSFEEVLPGGYAERSILLSNTKEVPVMVRLAPEGSGSQWLAFGEREFLIESSGRRRVLLSLSPPAGTERGSYESRLLITATPQVTSPSVGNQLAVTNSIPVAIEVVGSERSDCVVGGLRLPDFEHGKELQLSFSVKNTGNTRLRPRGNLSLFSAETGELIHTATFSEEEETLPTTVGRYFFSRSVSLEEGSYFGRLLVENCGELREVPFSVLPVGSLRDEGELLRLAAPPAEAEPGVSSLGAEFRNTGERYVTAFFSGVLERDGEILRVIESDPLLVAPGEAIPLTRLLDISEPGSYRLRGRVLYEGRQSEERSTDFTIASPLPVERLSVFRETILFFLFLLLVALLVLWRNRKEKL